MLESAAERKQRACMPNRRKYTPVYLNIDIGVYKMADVLDMADVATDNMTLPAFKSNHRMH